MRTLTAILAFVLAVPAFAAIAPEITIPVAGQIYLPQRDLVYLTDLTITNHRDRAQAVMVLWIDGDFNEHVSTFTLDPKRTLFRAGSQNSSFYGPPNRVGALQFRAVDSLNRPDPNGQLEVNAFIVAERGRFGLSGQSRQEVKGIPASEYFAPEAVFVGIRHDLPTYTNVGIVNLDETNPMTFHIQFQFYAEPVIVTVPPMTPVQIRLPGEGNAGRHVIVTPEWALQPEGALPTTPWVAYASTVDGYTGDAHSGERVPVGFRFR